MNGGCPLGVTRDDGNSFVSANLIMCVIFIPYKTNAMTNEQPCSVRKISSYLPVYSCWWCNGNLSMIESDMMPEKHPEWRVFVGVLLVLLCFVFNGLPSGVIFEEGVPWSHQVRGDQPDVSKWFPDSHQPMNHRAVLLNDTEHVRWRYLISVGHWNFLRVVLSM